MKRFLACLAVVACLLIHAQADAVTTNSIVTAQTPNNNLLAFCQVSGTPTGCTNTAANTFQTVYTAAVAGSRCNALIVSTNDGTQAHVVQFEIVNSTNLFPISSFTPTVAPVNNTTIQSSDALSPANFPGLRPDSDGATYLQLKNGDVLKAAYASAITANDYIIIVPFCSDF